MKRITDMTVGKPSVLLFRLALPILLTNLGQQLYTIVDGAIIGRGVGVAALAAVGATDWSYWLVLWIALGVTQGFSTFIAQHFGDKNYREMNKTIAVSVVLSALVGVTLSLMSFLLARPLLILLDTPADIIDTAVLYFRTLSLGMMIITAYNTAAAILRALGDGQTPLYAMVIAGALNVGLDLLLVLAFNMGVFGAALATVLAQLIAFIYCLFVLKRVPYIQLTKADFRLSWRRVKPILLFSLPLAFQAVVISVGGMFLQSAINGEGSQFVAGIAATNKLYGLLECSAISLGTATATYLAQNYGAGMLDRVRDGIKTGFLFSTLGALIVMGVALPLRRVLLSLFIDVHAEGGEAAFEIGLRYLTPLLFLLIILYLLHLYRNVLQAMGISLWSFLSGAAEMLLRTASALTLIAALGIEFLFFVEPLAWLAGLLLVIPPFLYYQKKRLFDARRNARSPDPD